MTKREIRNPMFCGRSKSYSTILMKCIGFQNFLFCSFDVWWSTKLLTVFFLQFCIFVYLGRTHFSSRLTVYKTITSKGWLWNLGHPMESHLHIWYSPCTKRIFSLLHGPPDGWIPICHCLILMVFSCACGLGSGKKD
jgi:hypothetical protein